MKISWGPKRWMLPKKQKKVSLLNLREIVTSAPTCRQGGEPYF